MMPMPAMSDATNVQTRYPNDILRCVEQYRKAQPSSGTLTMSQCLRMLVVQGLLATGFMEPEQQPKYPAPKRKKRK